jgi:cardiolipin synthase
MFRRIVCGILSRNTAFWLLILLQTTFIMLAMKSLGSRLFSVPAVLDVAAAVCVTAGSAPPGYKLAWILLIALMPGSGGIIYIYFRLTQKSFPREVNCAGIPEQDEGTMASLRKEYPEYAGMSVYIAGVGGYPVYHNRRAEYYPLGELQFEAIKMELAKATEYIYMEYFIIRKGKMFSEIAELLCRKAEQGLDVRLLYDGMGTGTCLSGRAMKRLTESGVRCRVFNPFRPFLSTVQNNRDHRKILVIDGVTAFNGGANIADEYINCKERFGHWKDTAVMIQGEAAANYAAMFLQLWENTDHESRSSSIEPVRSDSAQHDGYVQPFSDSPLDAEPVGKRVYLELIGRAESSVCITTPYLVPDEELLGQLVYAAKKGVDIRLITPAIPDKKYVQRITRSYYSELISTGVRIYEYTPGFIHAKCCVSDCKAAVIGTINLDYRSFYLHFESAAVFYGSSVIGDMQADFEASCKLSHEVTAEECRERRIWDKAAGRLLRIAAPLL